MPRQPPLLQFNGCEEQFLTNRDCPRDRLVRRIGQFPRAHGLTRAALAVLDKGIGDTFVSVVDVPGEIRDRVQRSTELPNERML